MAETEITSEMMDKMRSKFGLKLDVSTSVNNEYATRLAILKFAEGIGDTNPLWCNAEYARKTRYGGIVAPPSFVWACLSHVQFGWPGLGGFHGGCDIRFFKPVRLGDKISVEVVYDKFDGPKSSAFADEVLIDHFHNDYRNQDGDLAAQYRWWIIRVVRAKSREKGKYREIRLPHPWTRAELHKIESEILSEERRGNDPLYWEDVRIGDLLRPVVKGPLGVTDMIAFCIGGAAPTPRLQAHEAALSQYRRHPAWAFRDPSTCALEPIFAVHYNKQAANAMGLQQPYNMGMQTHCWTIHLLTNWMGDDGWIKRSQARYQNFVYHSDVVWIRGFVSHKMVDETGGHCVEIETEAVNQRDERVMVGSATIALPTRASGAVPRG